MCKIEKDMMKKKKMKKEISPLFAKLLFKLFIFAFSFKKKISELHRRPYHYKANKKSTD